MKERKLYLVSIKCYILNIQDLNMKAKKDFIIISLGFRSIFIFSFGLMVLSFICYQLINLDIFMRVILIPVLMWLLISLTFMSFTHVRFKQDKIIIRGDFCILKNQVQKRTVINYIDMIKINTGELGDHLNSRSEMLKFDYKYGNERTIIYGLGTIKCIEISTIHKLERLITNKYSKKQVAHMVKILKNKLMLQEIDDITD